MEKEKFDLENFPTSVSAKKMLSYVSNGFYDMSYVGKWIYQAMGLEYDKALEMVEDLPAQFFPETATWGLMYHEIKWGLPVRMNLSYEERRRLIYEKRDYRAPMTPYRMERYLKDAIGFEVRITDVHDLGEYGFDPQHPNIFKAYFIGDGTLDTKRVFEILDRLKQSHTTYRVNHRTEVILDNKNLEQIILRNIRLKLGIPFFCGFVFDGSWLFDGSVLLDNRRRYWLLPAIRYRLGISATESVMLYRLSFGWTQSIIEEDVAAGAGCSVFVSGLSERVEVSLAVGTKIDSSEQETVENVTAETKTSDYWFFDGTVLLDGSRKFNSIYRKEAVD